MLLTEKDLSDLLRVSPRTLQAQRQNGTGIPFLKIGRLVRYDSTEVDMYLKDHNRISTSQCRWGREIGAA